MTDQHIGERDYGFDTLTLHAGQEIDPTTTARAVPINQSNDILYDLDSALNGA